MKTKLIVSSVALLIIASGAVIANKMTGHGQHNMQHSQQAGMNHQQHMAQMNATMVPKEAGQGGFAAIAEIVGILSANPDTDWTTVDINGLREHLLAMDYLVTGAVVKEQAINNGMRFNVTGEGKVLSAIQQMVPAHAGELDKMPEFTASTEKVADGIALIITAKDEATMAKIKGLGFFGLMATGSHHQAHHFAMATGQGHVMHH